MQIKHFLKQPILHDLDSERRVQPKRPPLVQKESADPLQMYAFCLHVALII